MSSTKCQAKSRSKCPHHGTSALRATGLALTWDAGSLKAALNAVTEAKNQGLPFDAAARRVEELEGSVAEKLAVIRDGAPNFDDKAASVVYVRALGVNPSGKDDTDFNSRFVYCAEHSAVHESGFCDSPNSRKAPLAASSLVEAEAECREADFVLAEKAELPLSEQLLPWADKTDAMKIRDAIFLAPNRTYGETYMEPVLRKIFNLEKGKGGDHDAVDPLTGERYEIKCSKVLLAKPKKVKGKKKKKGSVEEDEKSSLFDTIVDQAHADPLARIISFDDRKTAQYDANIQNVKRDHFDQLVYVLLYAEKIQIFKMPKHEVNKDFIGAWSEKHGRADAHGKNGQFNIKHGSIEEHEKKYFHKSFTWEELVPLYKEIDAKNGN